MPFNAELISKAADRYRRERDRYVKLSDRVAEICRDDICDQNAIRAQVTSRVKSEKSFKGKLERFSAMEDRNYNDVDEIFSNISDLAGVRIAAYRIEDCEKLVEHLQKEFTGPMGEIIIDRKEKKSPENTNYYQAIHAQVCLPEDQLIGTYENVDDISCEIQICSMIAHVWNEIEHDIGYKSELGVPSDQEDYYLNQLGSTVRQGDLLISSLLAAHEHRLNGSNASSHAHREAKFRDVYDFVSRMRDSYNGVMPNFARNSGQLFDLLTYLELTEPAALTAEINPFNAEDLMRIVSNFNEYLDEVGTDERRLDPSTSDLLFVALLEKKLHNILEKLRGRSGRGRGRPTRLHSMASRFRDWKNKNS
jgi:ppGpp synthetase/RelA/SpoT-type nucleotidyltranferase